jgi:phage terminase large subunit-like protein
MDTTETQQVLGSELAGVMRADGTGAIQDDGERASAAPRENGRNGKFSADIWSEVERAYMSGETAAMVAGRFGMSPQTLYVHMAGRGKRAERLKLRASEKRAAEVEAGKAREAPSPEALALMMARELAGLGDRLIEAAGLREAARLRADGSPALRRHHAKELWAAARRDYEAGDFTAGVIAERYGMVESTIRHRAWKGRWSKTATEEVLPLHPEADPAQVDEDGASAWLKNAHAAQLPPEGEWSTWLFQGGRGAGKTRAGAEWLAARAAANPRGIFALVGPTQHDVREVMIDGPSGLRSLPGRDRPTYESSRRKLRWKNGAVAYAFSAEEPERLRGPQFEAAWVDEFCIWPKPDHTMAMLRMGLRLGSDPRLVVTTTPKPIASLRKLRAEVSCVTTQAGTLANAANLTPSFLSGLEKLYGGTRLAEQELDGVLVEGEGALWKVEELAAARAERPSKFDRVVVGVDPPAGVNGSACGIVVAGRLGGRGYVLEDASAMGLSPLGWAKRAAEAAERWGARRIIAESNQGGEMVRTTLIAAGVKCAVELVHATQSKRARAEPVAALYEHGLVSHCGVFPQLQEEMLAIGGEGQTGLDRADALVWAMTALMLAPVKPKPAAWML